MNCLIAEFLKKDATLLQIDPFVGLCGNDSQSYNCQETCISNVHILYHLIEDCFSNVVNDELTIIRGFFEKNFKSVYQLLEWI